MTRDRANAAASAIVIAAPAGAAQLGATRALFEEYAASLDFELCFQDFAAEMAAFPGAYAPPGGGLLLARVDGAAAGAVAFRPLGPATCEMKRLYVRPAFRGLGVGRHLAAGIVAASVRGGYRAMRLDTVPSMTAAIALYRRLGFRPIPAYTHNPIPGAHYMELALD